ncbi:MAG: cytochrome bc complex cytochrome b subunit [Nitrospirae bacterium]|nr:MAG: cytochrome bc complex cytochrome b subunit [Nitrospirota bacterium]
MGTGLYKWLDERLKLAPIRIALLDEPIPGGASWIYVFGSVTLFFFLLQMITGMFLAIYYSPSTEHAHASIRYIMDDVAFGSFIRGLHHWGASGMMVAIGLHMLQVFLYGAYKRPRELMWIVGVMLFILTLAFGFSGYLLPWDQRAYWATQVGINIVGTIPLVGDVLVRIIRGGQNLGAMTLNRFYALHTLFLPWLVMGLIGLHLFILRRVGPAGPWDEARAAQRSEPFWPKQVAMDAVAIGIAFILVVGLAVASPAPLADPANPSDTTFRPRPEWYFLFYYQLLKYLEGPWEVVGTLILPILFFSALFLLPWLDRRKERRPASRPAVLSAGAGFLLIVFTLLTISIREVASLPKQDPSVLRGKQLYQELDCAGCHRIHGEGGTFGPDLSYVGDVRDRDWLIRHFRDPQAVVPGSPMPAFGLNEQELNDLTNYMLTLKRQP